MSIDVIGNFLTIIRNGIALGKRYVEAPHSKMNTKIAEILKREGFIQNVEVHDISDAIKKIRVYLRYVDGESAIHEITRISTPGRRRYAKSKNLEPVVGNFGISILSTNKGLMTDKEAQDSLVGGELICSVW